MDPLISIVIPTYNHANFLSRALESVKNQQYTNWEVIVVDNYSIDNTDEIVKSFLDHRIKLLKIRNYGIIAASRNLGIKTAKGEWIAFLDSDDWWTPEKLKICSALINDEVDLIYHNLKIVREKPSFFDRNNVRSRRLKDPVLFDLLINDNSISNSSVVVRKSLLDQIGGLDEKAEMVGAEDYNAWLRIAKLTDRFQLIPRFLGFYQIHKNGMSRKNMTECYKCAISEFMPELSKVQSDRISGTLFYMQGRFCLESKEFNHATAEFYNSVRKGGLGIKLKSLYMLALAGYHNLFSR